MEEEANEEEGYQDKDLPSHKRIWTETMSLDADETEIASVLHSIQQVATDEQSGALHMFALCLANFVLPTSPRSSLGAQSSCSQIPCLSTIPPLILSSPQLLHMF